jgi:RNA polymerase sigma factor (sigma-70 family)
MSTELSDEMLMLRYRDGDLAAFQELYRRHKGGLYRFISWRSPRADWVDEIFQDSWAALHNARAGYQPQAGFRTYLYQIARNRLIDLLRQNHLLLASELGGAEEGEGDVLERLADAQAPEETPETALARKQDMAGLHAALLSLPGEQREALVLQQFNGLSLEEIAQLTETPVETIKSRLRYAMRKLRQQLAGQAGSREELA